jgi:hypothetical protein
MVRVRTNGQAIVLVNVVVVCMLVMWYMAHSRTDCIPPDPDFAVVRRNMRYRRALNMLRIRGAVAPWRSRPKKSAKNYTVNEPKLSSKQPWVPKWRKHTTEAPGEKNTSKYYSTI